MSSNDLPVRYDPIRDTEGHLTHVLVRNTGEPDELAIFPAATEDMTIEEWISATGESFTCLRDAR